MGFQYVPTNVSPSSGPITKKILITPDDDVDVMTTTGDPRIPRCLEVITPGSVTYVLCENEELESFTDNIAAAPVILPIAVRRVLATGTSATVRACY